MSAILLAAIWLAFVLPLIVAAVGRHSMGTKLGALLALAIVLAASWVITIIALGTLSAHEGATGWPSPLLLAAAVFCGFAVVSVAALQRKPR